MEAAKKGRFNAYAEDGFQFVIQILYLGLLGAAAIAVTCLHPPIRSGFSTLLAR